MRVRQYNRRYFTLDFGRRQLFYSHGENSKKASTVIAFAEIVEVRRAERRESEQLADNASECSRVSRTSFMRRMSSGLSKSGKEHEPEHCLTVLTKPAKTMELICHSAAEAAEWYEALAAAARSGAEVSTTEADVPIPSDNSENGSSGAPSPPGAEVAPQAAAANNPTSGYPEAPKKPPLAPRPQPAAARPEAAAAELPAGSEAGQDGRPHPVCGTFLDFNTEPDEAGGPAAPAPGGGDAGASAITTVGAAANCTPFKVSDFGLTAEDDVDSDDSSSAGEAPPNDAGTGSAVACPSRGTSKENAPDTSRAYHDRHEGLSVQQRLANLEFSDDEEDDDDPLGLKAKNA